jgi:regulator of replication initiation timing
MVMERRADDNKNYELLIRLDEKVTSLTHEFKDMKENLGGRITELERSRVQFKDLEALRSSMMEAIRELTDDGKSRAAQIELLTKYFWMAIGALATLQTFLVFFQDAIKSIFAR